MSSNIRMISDHLVIDCRTVIRYGIYRAVLASPLISEHDLLPPDRYREFFQGTKLDAFLPLSSHCSYFYSCVVDRLTETIKITLPQLLEKYSQMSNGK